MPNPSLDPITGSDPSTLTTAILAERLANERALREQAMDFIEKALELQANEYERRLDALNHAHEAAVVEQARTVPRTDFQTYVEATRRELALAFTASSKEIETERQARIRAEGSLATWRFIVLLLGLPGIVGVCLGLLAVFGPK